MITSRVGNLSNSHQGNVNSLHFLSSQSHRKRSHEHRRNKPSKTHVFDFLDMLPPVQTKLGRHETLTKLFALPLKDLPRIQEETLNRKICFDYKTPEYKLTSIILSVVTFRVESQQEIIDSEKQKQILHIEFVHKGIDSLNLSSILYHSKVKKKIPPYSDLKKKHTIPVIHIHETHSDKTI